MKKRKAAVIILAAGLGTRMKSDKAKVLHEILGRPMILYVVETAKKISRNAVILVVGYQAEKVRQVVSEKADVAYALQERQLGTGHAVSCALPLLPDDVRDVIILCGDVPLLRSETALQLLGDHTASKRDLTVLAVEVPDPTGYGRILVDGKGLVKGIVEESDASEQQKRITTVNSGIYCVEKEFLKEALSKLKPDNTQKEFYLTDIIEIGYKAGKRVGVTVSKDYEEVVGVNSRRDLEVAARMMRGRRGKIS